MTRAAIVAVIATLASACHRAPAAPADAAPAMAPPIAKVAAADAAISGSVFELRDPSSHATAQMIHGVVSENRGVLTVLLASDITPRCDGSEPGPPNGARFEFVLPPGPGGTYYAGKPFGVPAISAIAGGGAGLSASYIAFTVDTPSLTAGAHVRGTIDVGDSGRGTFDAVVCPGIDPAKLRALPVPSSSSPFSGIFGDAPFAVKSALVNIDPEEHSTVIRSIELYAEPGMTCAKQATPIAGVFVMFDDIGGASTDRTIVGTPQPASGGGRPRADANVTEFGPDAVWIQLDAFEITPGKTLTGRAVIDAPDAMLAGTFRAIVCPPHVYR